MDEVSADGARDTDCCSQASSDDECSNDSKSLASAQRSFTATTAASIKNKESTASLKKGSSRIFFVHASTSLRAPSSMGSDDEGDMGSYTLIPLGKTNHSLVKANQLVTRLNSQLTHAPTACENQPNQLALWSTNRWSKYLI